MTIQAPIFGGDSSDNNTLSVSAFEREGWAYLIQRRTGGLDLDSRGRWIPWVDRRFKTTNAGLKNTNVIPGDYGYPIHLDYLDLDVQIDRFLHSGPDDFEGRLVAVDYERYSPRPVATPTPAHVRAYCAELRKHIGSHPILLYAGKSFWEEPPTSGLAASYGPNVYLWAPWYFINGTQETPRLHYHNRLADAGWWQHFGGQLPVMSQFCIGRVAGIPLDCNAYRGTMDQLRALTVSGATVPIPTDPGPTPTPPGDWPAEAPPKAPIVAPRAGNYFQRHPTRYGWRPDVREYVYKLFRTFGGISMNTYHKHPGVEITRDIRWSNRDTTSVDIWARAGRDSPIDPVLGQAIVTYLMVDPNPPYIDWLIHRGRIWTSGTRQWASYYPDDDFMGHWDHLHVTFTGPSKVIP